MHEMPRPFVPKRFARLTSKCGHADGVSSDSMDHLNFGGRRLYDGPLTPRYTPVLIPIPLELATLPVIVISSLLYRLLGAAELVPGWLRMPFVRLIWLLIIMRSPLL